MNANSSAKTVLCYGDSNTWGQKPDKSGRFPADVRWTGLLQRGLGDDYYIIEEGLSSRTTDLEYDKKPGRNGKTYLGPCLESHNPLDYIVLMLGTNDLKLEFNRGAADIASALNGFITIINEKAKTSDGNSPIIILVSPILVDDTAPNFAKFYTDFYNHESVAKSEQFGSEIQKVAGANGCIFLNAALIANPGEDGLHFSKESHQKLATALIALLQTN